jgi:rhodanese-related sulfurtransferase
MILKTALFFILFSFSALSVAEQLGLVSAEELQNMQQHEHALVVDIRTPEEWKTGVIPESKKLESFHADGHFDSAKWLDDLQKLKSQPDQPVILVCRSGNRSNKVGQFLVEQGMPKVYHLKQGIQSWVQSGYPLSKDSANSLNP